MRTLEILPVLVPRFKSYVINVLNISISQSHLSLVSRQYYRSVGEGGGGQETWLSGPGVWLTEELCTCCNTLWKHWYVFS